METTFEHDIIEWSERDAIETQARLDRLVSRLGEIVHRLGNVLWSDMTKTHSADHDDMDSLREAVAKLTHELAEALTATNNYLRVRDLLKEPSDPRLHEATGRAIEQLDRAAKIVSRLRTIASKDTRG